MMEYSKEQVLERIKANDQHPERGEIKFAIDSLGNDCFERISPSFSERWHTNGQLRELYSYNEKGRVDGLGEEWYSNGQLYHRCLYKDGVPNGLFQFWYKNGQLEYSYTYKDGRRDGLYQDWHNNGQLSSRYTYENGKVVGKVEFWHDNGQPRALSFHNVSGQDGLALGWHYNGQQKYLLNYKNDKLEGPWLEWHDDGRLWIYKNYKNGKIDGLQEKANRDGTITQSVYRDGSFLDERIAYEFSNLSALQVAKNSHEVFEKAKIEMDQSLTQGAVTKEMDKEIEISTCRFQRKPKPSSLTQKVKELGATLPSRSEGSSQTKAVKNSNKLNKL